MRMSLLCGTLVWSCLVPMNIVEYPGLILSKDPGPIPFGVSEDRPLSVKIVSLGYDPCMNKRRNLQYIELVSLHWCDNLRRCGWYIDKCGVAIDALTCNEHRAWSGVMQCQSASKEISRRLAIPVWSEGSIIAEQADEMCRRITAHDAAWIFPEVEVLARLSCWCIDWRNSR